MKKSDRGTTSRNKEINSTVERKNTKKKQRDHKEVCEPVNKRAKTNNKDDNHVRRNLDYDFSTSTTTSTGVTSFPVRSAERTKKGLATLATMKGNAVTSAPRRTSPQRKAKLRVQRRTT